MRRHNIVRVSLRRKITVAFGAALVILFVVAAISYRSMRRLDTASEQVVRSYRLRVALDDLIARTIDTETAQRGYVITGDPAYLEPHLAAVDTIRYRLAEVQRMIEGDAGDERQLDTLTNLIRNKLAFSDTVIHLRAAESEARAVAAVRTGRGKLIMDEIRRVIGAMEEKETTLLAEQLRRQRASSRLATRVVVGGFGLALLIAIVATLAVRRDIRRRERAERRAIQARDAAEAASRAKSEFLARMSHELRTPLNSVIGFSNILLKNKGGNLREQELGYLQRIQANGKHLLGLINDILDLSRIEARKLELDLGRVSLDQLVRETVLQFNDHSSGKDVVLRTDLPALIAPIEADAAKLKQVLINLIGNALKFTERGAVSVRLFVEQGTGRSLRIDVSDTGIGIPVDRLEAVFTAFEQADSSTTRQFGGTGLGLAITRGLCDLMGYRIKVVSEVGAGSVFSVLLTADAPLPQGGVRLVPAPALEEPLVPVEAEWDFASRRKYPLVLIIDDEIDSRTVLSHYFQDAGCRVITSESGEQGLRLARNHGPDLITLDLLMPSQNGWETLKEIKADPELCDIPVIVVSVVAGENRGKVLGAVDFVDKPIARDDLIQVLRHHLGHSSGRVLVVDDDESARKLLIKHLELDGRLEIRTATNGREGLEVLEQFLPDLVILDLLMPVMDGVEFLTALRSDSRFLHLPVMIVTAKAVPARAAGPLQAQVLAVVEKGDQLGSSLEQVIDQVLHQRGSRDRAAPPVAQLTA